MHHNTPLLTYLLISNMCALPVPRPLAIVIQKTARLFPTGGIVCGVDVVFDVLGSNTCTGTGLTFICVCTYISILVSLYTLYMTAVTFIYTHIRSYTVTQYIHINYNYTYTRIYIHIHIYILY